MARRRKEHMRMVLADAAAFGERFGGRGMRRRGADLKG